MARCGEVRPQRQVTWKGSLWDQLNGSGGRGRDSSRGGASQMIVFLCFFFPPVLVKMSHVESPAE